MKTRVGHQVLQTQGSDLHAKAQFQLRFGGRLLAKGFFPVE
jgi:hypothetical protein